MVVKIPASIISKRLKLSEPKKTKKRGLKYSAMVRIVFNSNLVLTQFLPQTQLQYSSVGSNQVGIQLSVGHEDEKVSSNFACSHIQLSALVLQHNTHANSANSCAELVQVSRPQQRIPGLLCCSRLSTF